MEGPNYQERVERNYEVIDVSQDGVALLWRELTTFFSQFKLYPINEITNIGTVYFDNKDYDLTRYTVLNPGRRMLVRLRTYETFGALPTPISEYWIEIKTRSKGQWRKKRVKLSRAELADFLDGKEISQSALPSSAQDGGRETLGNVAREIQELILTMGLKPFFLLTYKRLAFQNEFGDERVSLDWANQYYHVGTEVFSYDSWKYPIQEPAGRSEKTILELKYAQGTLPIWITKLEKKYPIRETGFLKFVEGMGYLLRGPLKYSHKDAPYFLRLVDAYGGESGWLG
jgi:hypothetical protein